MSLAIIDAREWQNVFDLKTGIKKESGSAKTEILKNVLSRHPYPGDLNPDANKWVTDTALDLLGRYDADFAFLIYAQQMYSMRFDPDGSADIEDQIDDVFKEVERFSKESGFLPLIIGTGNMMRPRGFINLSGMNGNGLAVISNWSTRYAGIYNPDRKDFEYLNSVDEIDKIISREEFISLFPDAEGSNHLPDFTAVAKEGYSFKSTLLHKSYMIPSINYYVPVSTGFGIIDSITDIKSTIETALENRKVALILLDGIGSKKFRTPFTSCQNGKAWFCYEPGGAQYLTMSTGRHKVFEIASGDRTFNEDVGKKEYPFSNYFCSIPQGTLGSMYGGKSIAVGNRSTFMHTVTGADIAIECFARNLSNQGCMGVIHGE